MDNLREKYNIELPRARGAYLEEAPDKIWTEEGWVIECKEDGTRESLQIGAYESLMVGRNREGFLKGVEQAGPFMVHHHPIFSAIACKELEGTILDGECTMHFTKDGEYDETTQVLTIAHYNNWTRARPRQRLAIQFPKSCSATSRLPA